MAKYDDLSKNSNLLFEQIDDFMKSKVTLSNIKFIEK